jgi:phosphoglycerate kinase
MQGIPSIRDMPLQGKRVLIRSDFNVPMVDGAVQEATRITESLATIQYALEQQAGVILCSHLGRPEEGVFDSRLSLQPVADVLTEALGLPVKLISDWRDSAPVKPGELVLWENVRFNVGEMNNSAELGAAMASHCDVFVMDAFATAHRAQASTEAVASAAQKACAGLLLEQELQALGKAFSQPKRPLLAIVGGAKVSTKIQLLESLMDQVDTLIVGGGIANTFLKAKGYSIGSSLYEEDYVDLARELLATAQAKGVEMPLPVDVLTATEFAADAVAVECTVDAVQEGQLILDVGEKTNEVYAHLIQSAATVVWNGPVGVFEFENFSGGTQSIAEAIAHTDVFSIAGGGDTVAALVKFSVTDKMSYISTGGGAFLQYMQDGKLPAVMVLQQAQERTYVE